MVGIGRRYDDIARPQHSTACSSRIATWALAAKVASFSRPSIVAREIAAGWPRRQRLWRVGNGLASLCGCRGNRRNESTSQCKPPGPNSAGRRRFPIRASEGLMERGVLFSFDLDHARSAWPVGWQVWSLKAPAISIPVAGQTALLFMMLPMTRSSTPIRWG